MLSAKRSVLVRRSPAEFFCSAVQPRGVGGREREWKALPQRLNKFMVRFLLWGVGNWGVRASSRGSASLVRLSDTGRIFITPSAANALAAHAIAAQAPGSRILTSIALAPLTRVFVAPALCSPTRTRTRTNTNPNGTEANAVGRSLRACVARKSEREES